VIARLAVGALPKVTLVYHHPGRLRLRGDVLERSPSVAARMSEAVSRIDGVGRVAHRRASGSLLVEYAPERIDADAILCAVSDAGVLLEEKPRRPDASRAVVGATRGLNAQVGEATRGAADLHGIVSFALGVGAITSLALGRQPRWPRWDNLLYWSYTFFRDVHLREAERAGRRHSR
jgi:Heavy metal associated domain 2